MYPRLSYVLRFTAGMVIVAHQTFIAERAQWPLVTASLAMIFGSRAVEILLRRAIRGGDDDA